MEEFMNYLAGVANIFTIFASGIAIWLFITNREKISAAIQLLLNFSFQTTLAELKEKLERLNEYNANEPDDLPEILNILHEIAGQIRGNPRLFTAVPQLIDKIDALTKNGKLRETKKRAIVSEIREQLRNIQVNNIGSIMGKNHE